MKRILSFLLLPLLTVTHICNAQETFHITLKHISEENGLSDNRVTCVLKDNQNLIWIGTADGLNLLDGSAITIYKNNPNNSSSICSNNINCLLQADAKTIFIGTANGISAFDKNKKCFYSIPVPASKFGASNIITAFATDKNKNIWCCTDGGLYRYNISQKKMTAVINNNSGINKETANKLVNFYLSKNGKIWLCTYNGLWCHDISNNTFTRINNPDNDKTYESLTMSAFEGNDGKIWFGNWSTGLKNYDPNTGKIKTFISLKNALSNVTAVNQIKLPNGKNAICTNNELNYLDTSRNSFFNFLNSFGSTNTPNILNFYTDPSDFLWMGSNTGVYIYAPQCQLFQQHIFTKEITGQNINFLEFKNRILIGAENSDFLKYYSNDLKQEENVLPHYRTNDATLGLYKENNNILISTTGGIIKYDPVTEKHIIFKHSANDSASLPRNFIQKLFIDSKSQCWIFPWRLGIYKMNTATGKCTLLCRGLTKKENGIKGFVITDAAEDEYGNIWMADLDEGIIEYDAKENKFLKPFNKQLGDAVHSARIIYRNGYCYSFSNTKLLKWNTTDKKIIIIDLPNNINVTDFILDKQNNWWIATKKGLLVYLSGLDIFKTITSAEGLYTNLMDGIFYNKANGDILFCSSKYITMFTPEKILNTFNRSANLILTGFGVNGNEKSYDSIHPLRLNYESNNISLKWALTDYVNPLQNSYYCKLQGIDTGYKYVGNRGEIQYASLSPGDYTILLTGNTANGGFAKNPIKIHFKITPPFWKTIWFLVICAAVLGLSLFFLVRKRIKNIREKAFFQQQMSELELKALRAQMNPHFIFNSLSSIQESIINNDPEIASLYLNKFSKLIRLVLENSGKKYISLTEEIDYLQLYLELESFRFEDLQFQINCTTEETAFIKIPPMIVQPYIENALKHGLAHKKGSKLLTVNFYTDTEENLFAEVIDNGIGRKQSAVINQSRLASHQSMGMQITEQRLLLLRNGLQEQIVIKDLVDDDSNAAGTYIKILLPTEL